MRLALLLAAFAAAAPAQTQPESLIEAGHWKRARALVDPQLRRDPNDPLANFFASQIGAAFGGRENPLLLAEKAVSLDGSVAKFHRQLAEMTGALAEHANVFQQIVLARRFTKELDRALELDPTDIQALSDRIEYYLLAPGIVGGDKTQANAVAARIARIDAAEGFAAQARIASFEKRDDRAGALLNRAIAADPGKYKIWIALARTQQAPGHLPDAEAAARRAIALDDSRAAGYSILAAILARQNRKQELQELLQRSDSAVPDDLTPHYRAGEALLASGHPGEAARQLQTYLTQEPEGNEPDPEEARRLLGSIPAKARAPMPN